MERTSGRNLEYLGLGYSTTIKQYEHNRYINSDYFKGLQAGATSQSKRREEARLLRETELQVDAEDLALAVQRRPHLDSKVVKFEEMKAVVDSGSTVSLSDLAGGTILYDYEPDAAIRVQAFNSSTSRGKGRGTIVGWGTDVNGVRVPFRVPRVHRLEGNTINLLSVSSLAAMGNEFHFTRQRSWMKTPDGHEIDFEHKGGLYWLRWQRAIDPRIQAKLFIRPKPLNRPFSGKTRSLYYPSKPTYALMSYVSRGATRCLTTTAQTPPAKHAVLRGSAIAPCLSLYCIGALGTGMSHL